MSDAQRRVPSMRRRLFVSHVAVIAVAIALFAIVLGIIGASSDSRSSDDGRRSEGPAPLALAVAIAGSAAALVSWRVSKRLAAPLDAISAATRQLSAGRYDVRVPGADVRELDALVRDVNELARRLDTTEQQRLRLIGDVAHELRNPLSTIEGTMEALLDDVVNADEATFTRVGREAARLRRLADDLSSLSAAGELHVEGRDLVDLTRVVVGVATQLEPQAIAKDITLHIDTAMPAVVLGDGDRLTQVMLNVIGNAVQYTETGGIRVRVTTTPHEASVEVIDTGRGLAPHDRSRIFDRFHRVDDHFTDGTGVGLAIAKLIVLAHDGVITADSEGLGRGTTIRIDLPTGRSDSNVDAR